MSPSTSFHPDPANPRRISDAELDALTRSLRQFGFVQPVLVRREDSTVIGGHQRLVAARRLGHDTVPVVWLDVSAEQARLLGLALNRISGTWDDQLLARLLSDLGEAPDIDLSMSGFGEDEITAYLRKLAAAEKADRTEDFDVGQAVEAATTETKSHAGDLWPLGAHRLLCGDATSRDDVERLLDGATPSLMVTDPPYGVEYDPSWRNEVADGRESSGPAGWVQSATTTAPTGPRPGCCHRHRWPTSGTAGCMRGRCRHPCSGQASRSGVRSCGSSPRWSSAEVPTTGSTSPAGTPSARARQRTGAVTGPRPRSGASTTSTSSPQPLWMTRGRSMAPRSHWRRWPDRCATTEVTCTTHSRDRVDAHRGRQGGPDVLRDGAGPGVRRRHRGEVAGVHGSDGHPGRGRYLRVRRRGLIAYLLVSVGIGR